MTTHSYIVVDGANVAYAEVSHDGKPKVSNLVAVRRTLEARGYRPIFIIDASLRHDIDDPKQLEALIDAQVIRQAPAGTDADYFVLETADEMEACVVSNDEFTRHRGRYPWIDERRIPLMLIKGRVELYERDFEKSHEQGH
ncbi:MAG: NYN domain-containing protein [Chloroflexota bacterium]